MHQESVKQIADDTPRSPKAERTRKSLVAAAQVVFESDGLIEARVADIVKQAGVAHGTFYTYFDSKDQVFQVLGNQFFDEIRTGVTLHDAPSDDRDPFQSILRANRAYIEILHRNARLALLVWMHTANERTDLSARLQEEKDFFVRRTELGITRFQQMGHTAFEVDARYVARALASMIDQFCVQWFLNDIDFEIEQATRALTEIWARAIGVPVPDEPQT